MPKKKYPALRKAIREFVAKQKDCNLICSSCGYILESYKAIVHYCPKCNTKLIEINVSTIYSAVLNGKCTWIDWENHT